MIKIEPIAVTREIESITAEELNYEQTLLSGKFGGTCYAREGYATIRTQPDEKALRRAERTAENGHHSVFQHGVVNMEITCPKIIAMLLNSIGVSNTSEKSARYTRMEPETKRELFLYEKWHDRLKKQISERYGDRLEERETDKLAYENARYMISVFCETSMVYSLPFRNIFYLLDWIRGMRQNLSARNGGFNQRLQRELASLQDALLQVVGKENFHDNKNEYFRFLPVQALGEYDNDNKEYYGDVYTARFLASFAQVAQEQRHRTTRVKISFSGDEPGEFGYYVPPILGDAAQQEEWLSDIASVGEVYPQGMLVSVTEQGLFEDFALKCKERMCGRAQLEIMQVTEKLVEQFLLHRENLSGLNQKRLAAITDGGKPCARCAYPDFSCQEGCVWGKRDALNRLI
ncbi:MAG: FAD-dependent thymidylate synthase [Clostridiaceae bacterium]|nr:FAD-dependent thymidylate synthase [Clostridiaceae bacterium]